MPANPSSEQAHSHALLSTKQMGQVDAWAMAHGVSGFALMEEAGRAVAQAIMARWSRRAVLVCCGPGNNGGDGHVVARWLAEAGWPVTLACVVPVHALRGDALRHAKLTQARCTTQLLDAALLNGMELLVDALYGAGLARPVAGVAAQVLSAAAEQEVPIVAVDVPSGLQGDTGAVWGAVKATLTVTFFRKKPAHVLMPGRALCGDLQVCDIGIVPAALEALQPPVTTWENAPALWQGAWPYPGGLQPRHKYGRGHALVLGGAVMTGAARLSARAMARVGAGLTTMLVPQTVWSVYAGGVLCGMVQALDDHDVAAMLTAWTRHLATLNWQALVMGPGAALGLPGEANGTLRSLVLAALQGPLIATRRRGMVLDADALTAFEVDAGLLFDATNLAPFDLVLTPHEGEFKRLFGAGQQDKVDATKAAARLSGAVVLHKGPDTVVAAPDGRVVVNTNGSAWLATAGSGDVLSGLIGGLLAQGLPAFEAACAGAWLHGVCAEVFGPGLVADDLPEQLPAVLRRLWLP